MNVLKILSAAKNAGSTVLSFASTYQKYIILAVVCLCVALGAYFAVIRLADERCEGLVSADRITELEEEITALRSSQAKSERIRNEVQNVTQNITPGMLPTYTSAVLDCLRDNSSGESCM